MTPEEMLKDTRSIAIIGVSDNPSRPSHDVARYLSQFYRVFPVNPRLDEVLGMRCYPDLLAIPEPVDMVDVFQRSENVPNFVDGAIDINARYFWMQLGISNTAARATLETAGIQVVEDLCTKVVHARYLA